MTPRLYLRRTMRTADGVFGRLTGSDLSLATCEDDWEHNRPSISCIPDGTYALRRTMYYKHGYETFEVAGVPGRSRILIHPGNTEEDTAGCILVGLRVGRLWVAKDEDTSAQHVLKQAVVSSRLAFDRLMTAWQDVDEGVLTIEWAPEADPARLAA